MQLAKLVIVAGTFLAVRSAAAQPVPQIEGMKTVLPAVLPTATGATFDGRLDYVHLSESDNAPTIFALKLHGQYVAPQGIGGYLSLPVAYVSDDGESDSYVGNIELGGLYMFRGANVDAYARVGAALDVGANDEIDTFVLPIVSLTAHPADAVTTGFGSSWLRAGGGARFTSGALVLGGSLGVDVPIGDSEFVENLDNLLNLSVAVGLTQPGFGVAVGFTVVELLGEGDNDSLKTVQVTGDFEIAPQMRLYGVLGANFDDDSEGFSLGAGVRATL